MRSCVKLMSTLFEQPEKYVAFYLDLYYQVRLAYERGKEPPPLRREDLLPAMREIWGEMTAQSSADCRNAPAKKTPKAAKSSGGKAPSTASGPPPSEREAMAEEKKLGTWTIYKRRQLDRLRAARENGLTLAEIEKADKTLSVRTVTNMLGGQYATRDSWGALERVLDSWDQQHPAAIAGGQ